MKPSFTARLRVARGTTGGQPLAVDLISSVPVNGSCFHYIGLVKVPHPILVKQSRIVFFDEGGNLCHISESGAFISYVDPLVEHLVAVTKEVAQ